MEKKSLVASTRDARQSSSSAASRPASRFVAEPLLAVTLAASLAFALAAASCSRREHGPEGAGEEAEAKGSRAGPTPSGEG